MKGRNRSEPSVFVSAQLNRFELVFFFFLPRRRRYFVPTLQWYDVQSFVSAEMPLNVFSFDTNWNLVNVKIGTLLLFTIKICFSLSLPVLYALFSVL